jgi:hypothetical protein
MSLSDLVIYVRKLRALLDGTGIVPFLVIGPKRVEVKILRVQPQPVNSTEAVAHG